jgi:hypothetical protein
LVGKPEDKNEEGSKEDNKLTQNINELVRRVCWFIGRIAFSLIKVDTSSDEESKEKDKSKFPDEKMIKMLMESKLLSGGIESRFLTTFAEDIKKKLTPVLAISNDMGNLEFLSINEVNLAVEDRLLA